MLFGVAQEEHGAGSGDIRDDMRWGLEYSYEYHSVHYGDETGRTCRYLRIPSTVLRHFKNRCTARLHVDERHLRFALRWNLNRPLIAEKVAPGMPIHTQSPCTLTRS